MGGAAAAGGVLAVKWVMLQLQAGLGCHVGGAAAAGRAGCQVGGAAAAGGVYKGEILVLLVANSFHIGHRKILN